MLLLLFNEMFLVFCVESNGKCNSDTKLRNKIKEPNFGGFEI